MISDHRLKLWPELLEGDRKTIWTEGRASPHIRDSPTNLLHREWEGEVRIFHLRDLGR